MHEKSSIATGSSTRAMTAFFIITGILAEIVPKAGWVANPGGNTEECFESRTDRLSKFRKLGKSARGTKIICCIFLAAVGIPANNLAAVGIPANNLAVVGVPANNMPRKDEGFFF
ncbi:MAG TPA: hypothetical protein PK228_18310 [Saprospiraceae bacterium]|nr:hypothetical protein [Saprospiraceae bacterium]